MSDPIANFVTPLVVLFPVADEVDKPALFSALMHELRGFDDNCLARASAALRRSHNRRTFPSIATCIDACQAAAGRPKAAVVPDNWEVKQAKAERLLRGSHVAREAYAGGWLGGLWDFCAANGRLPDASEAIDVKLTSICIRLELLNEANENGIFAPLAQSMLDRIERRAIKIGLAS